MSSRMMIFLILYCYVCNQEATKIRTESESAFSEITSESPKTNSRRYLNDHEMYTTTTEVKNTLTLGIPNNENGSTNQLYGVQVTTDAIYTVSIMERNSERMSEESLKVSSLDVSWNVSDDCLVNITNSTTVSVNKKIINSSAIVKEEIPTWTKIFNHVELASTLIGFMANILTLITLYVSPTGFSKLILILFRHQSLVDSWVCAMASILIIQPKHWLTGYKYIDIFICHAWHSQAVYWGAVTLSIYNLVSISFERYVAVLHPFKHTQLAGMSRRKFLVWFVVLYVFFFIITFGAFWETRLKGGECVNEYAFDGPIMDRFFYAFVIFVYITIYFLPAFVMATVYGIISRKLHARKKDTSLGQSNVVDRAGGQVTKTAIAVTIIFIVSIGYDLHYYLLGHTGAVVYELNSPYQKMGVFLSNLNSCANPFVYAMLMPVFRRRMAETFCCQGRGKESEQATKHKTKMLQSSSAVLSSSLATISVENMSTDL